MSLRSSDSAVGGKQRRFCSVFNLFCDFQEESHCVTMAGDIFMEKLGMKLALERDNGRCDRGKCWVSEGVGKRREG